MPFFATAQAYGGGFRADQLTLQFAGRDAKGFHLEQIQYQFQQQVGTFYEIGSPNVYYVGGRANGSLTVQRVVGAALLTKAFVQLYNDLCKPANITMNASQGCPVQDGSSLQRTAGSVAYTFIAALLMGVNGNVTAQEVVIREGLQMQFIDLEVQGVNDGVAA